MTLFSIIIFFISLIVACALIARKIWLLRTSRIIPSAYEEAAWVNISIENIRTRLMEIGKFMVHHVVLFALKLWIISSYMIKRFDRFIRQKLTQILHRNAHITPATKPSEFLQDIQATKSEINQTIQNESLEVTEMK